jgi:hypothetical protein
LTKVVVRIGVVDVPVPDLALLAEQRNLLNSGFSARAFSHMRRYRVGEFAALPDSEARRLAALGIVEIVPS